MNGQNTTIFQRQNERDAQILLAASCHCYKRERRVKYFIIALSFLVCLCGIINKYVPSFFKGDAKATALRVQDRLSTYINLTSGAVIIITLLLSFYTYRMHLEGTVLLDRYDCRVFGLAPNDGLLRPISKTMIELYAAKEHKHAASFRNYYFSDEDDYDAQTAHFDNINRQLCSDQKLYMSIQPFFLTVWIGFCVIVVLMAISFNDQFVNTLINILIPSMSAITVIMNSWFNFRQQLRQMANALADIERILRLPEEERNAAMRNPFTLRGLQTALYNFRSSPFAIPEFLVRRHRKRTEKEDGYYAFTTSCNPIVTMAPARRTARVKTESYASPLDAYGPFTAPLEEKDAYPKTIDVHDSLPSPNEQPSATRKPRKKRAE